MSLFVRSIYTAAFLSLLYSAALYFSDSYKRESMVNIFLAVGAGVLSVTAVTLLKSAIPWFSDPSSSSSLIGDLFNHYIGAGVLEETAKLGLFMLVVWQFDFEDFSEPYDAMVYMGMVGVGFAVYEDFFYIFQYSFPPWEAGDINRYGEVFQFMVLQRAFPGHVLFNTLEGYYIGKAKFATTYRTTLQEFSKGFVIAVLAHGTFNLIGGRLDTGWLIVYVTLLTWAVLGLRSKLLSTSPYRVIRSFRESKGIFKKWEQLTRWNYPRPPAKYIELGRRRTRFTLGLIPLSLALLILYPIMIFCVFYLNQGLIKLFDLLF
ncbi:MAG: PrsW family intramembrane metalloprotease [Candidatus Bipolaricaulota bacterium]